MESTTAKNRGKIERNALVRSIVGYLLMAIAGIVFALITHSEAILLDGVYSLISFIMANLAIKILRLTQKPGSNTFHFGFAHFEPLLNLIRGFLILFLALFALLSAIDALMKQGRPIGAGIAVIYGGIAAAICLLISRLQERAARQVGSPMLEVDARNWFVDGIISSGAATAFLIAFFLTKTPWAYVSPYVDPLLVVLMVLALIRIPIITIWENIREVFMVAPEPVIQEAIRHVTDKSVSILNARAVYHRMWKVGRIFYVMIHVVLPEDHPIGSVREIDALRLRLLDSLRPFHKGMEIDVIFTADAAYASGEIMS